MNATVELKTIIDISGALRNDTPSKNSLVCQLLEQWKGRTTSQEQMKAWAPFIESDQLKNTELSCGLVWWLLDADKNGALTISLPAVCAHGNFGYGNEMAEPVLYKMSQDMSFPLSKEWKDTVNRIFYYLKNLCDSKQPLNDKVLALIETNRQSIAQHNLAWSEELCQRLPKRVRDKLYTDSKTVVVQQKIVKDLKRHFNSYLKGSYSHEFSVRAFLNKLASYPLSDQLQSDGILFGAVKELFSQCDNACLKIVVDDLTQKGWSKTQLWNVLDPNVVEEKSQKLDFAYMDVAQRLANTTQRKQIFTWGVEGLVNSLYTTTPSKILNKVQNLLKQPYAQPSVGQIELYDLREYTKYVIKTWENDPKISKKYDGDRYARTGLNSTTVEEFLSLNRPHFASPIMLKAIELLNTIKHPSLQGALEFWGRLHDIDYGVDKPQIFQLQEDYNFSGNENGDIHLWEKAQQVAQYIAIGGTLIPKTPQQKARKI